MRPRRRSWAHAGRHHPLRRQGVLPVERETCHGGPFLSDEKFHNVGLVARTVSAAFLRNNDRGAERGLAETLADPLNVKSRWSDGDDGRLPSSIPPETLGAFRTPMLRCSSKRPSFMHTGQLRSIEEVVAFFDRGGDKKRGVASAPVLGFLGETELEPLGLGDAEANDLAAFLKALDGAGPPANLLAAP